MLTLLIFINIIFIWKFKKKISFFKLRNCFYILKYILLFIIYLLIY